MNRKKREKEAKRKSKFRCFKLFVLMVVLALIAAYIKGLIPASVIDRIVAFISSAKTSLFNNTAQM